MIFSVFIMGFAGSMGITAGAHRLWSHRAYKAKWPLRFLLMLFQTLAYQVNFNFVFFLRIYYHIHIIIFYIYIFILLFLQ